MNYTIEHSVQHQVSSNQEIHIDSPPVLTTKSQEELRNNPNPILASTPLLWEDVIIDELEPYFMYIFSLYYENSAGTSERSDLYEISLPYSGIFSYEIFPY